MAVPCGCDRPQVFEAHQCHKCGHATGPGVSASTRRLAMAIAEAGFGLRPIAGANRKKDARNDERNERSRDAPRVSD